jgi:hypothetical protein
LVLVLFKLRFLWSIEQLRKTQESEQMGFHVANGIAYLPKSSSTTDKLM